MSKTYLGVDIGGTAVKLGLVDDTGRVLRRAERSVSFDEVHVRRHAMILDESRTNTGLTIDWECFEEERYSLEEQQETQKRSMVEPLGYKERIFILLRAGYSPTQLKQFMGKP